MLVGDHASDATVATALDRSVARHVAHRLTPEVEERRDYRVAGQAEPISALRRAVQAGDLLFVSGIVPVDSSRPKLSVGDVVAGTRGLRQHARRARVDGCSFADVVEGHVFP